MSSVDFKGLAVTGLVPCFFSHGRMFVISKMVPSAVHTGWEKGCKETAQKLKGSRLNEAPDVSPLTVAEPALAEYASSEAHSLCVICNGG